MKFYHRTTQQNAATILANGFKDSKGTYLTNSTHTGVWLSNIPLDENEGAKGETLLKVDLNLTEDRLINYEWIEDGKPYREWLAPAAVINAAIKRIEIVTDEEDTLPLVMVRFGLKDERQNEQTATHCTEIKSHPAASRIKPERDERVTQDEKSV